MSLSRSSRRPSVFRIEPRLLWQNSTSPSVSREQASRPGHIYVETTAKDQAQVYQGNVLLHPAPHQLHEYRQTSANDRAQIYQGATFTTHHHYGQGHDEQHFLDNAAHIAAQKQWEEKKKVKKDKKTFEYLMQSLAFERMDARFRNISTAMPMTVQWLFKHEDFLKWAARHHAANDPQGFFWIRGKPGSGKSTILKEIISWAKDTWKDEVRLCYFYHGRSLALLEKSSAGVYRTLVHQLLTEQPLFKSMFIERFRSKMHPTYVEDWEIVELQEFLLDVISSHGVPPLNIFIDALDEGTDEDGRQMVAFLQRLDRHAATNQHPVRICLSSRHYPHISINREIVLVVEAEPQHDRDIELYIEVELRDSQSPELDDLRGRLSTKSAGIFLWVVLVIPILNRIYDSGRDVDDMLAELDALPDELHNLFDAILRRRAEDFDDCVRALQWTLHAKRALSPEQLYAALRTSKRQVGSRPSRAPHPSRITRYLTHCSRGLLEVKFGKVQFIHQSVRDFLLGYGTTVTEKSRSADTTIHVFLEDACHTAIIQDCLSSMTVASAVLTSFRFHDPRYPLANYAAECWADHVRCTRGSVLQNLLESALKLLNHHDQLRRILYDYHIGQAGRVRPVRRDIDISTLSWAALMIEIILRLRKEPRHVFPSRMKAACQAALVVADVRLNGWIRVLLDGVIKGWSCSDKVTKSSVDNALHDHEAFARMLTEVDTPESPYMLDYPLPEVLTQITTGSVDRVDGIST